MAQERNKIHFSAEVLESVQAAAMENAQSLVAESALLSANGFYARAYFLAVAAIEEVGKGWMSFTARGRDLNAPDVQATLRREFEDHAKKILLGFSGVVTNMPPDQLRAEILEVVNRMIALKHGREPSMYVDVSSQGNVTSPLKVVRPVNGVDAPHLARLCLSEALRAFEMRSPPRVSKFQDRLYTLGKGALAVANTQDFWEFLLSRLEAHPKPVTNEKYAELWAECTVTYHDAYFKRGRTFLQKAVEDAAEQAEPAGEGVQ